MSVISLQMRMGGKCLSATQDSFIAIISTKEMADKAAAIASGQLDEETRRRVKESLPAMIVQAHFRDNVRKNENAILNPLVMVDLDHMEEEVDAVWSRMAPRAEELGIVMAYKTISTKGLRLVMRWRQGLTTIEQNQRWLAEQVGLEKYWDCHCTDPARLSFLVPQSYFYTLDPAIFDPEEAVPEWFIPIREGYGKPPSTYIPPAAQTDAVGAAVAVPEGTQSHYGAIPLTELAAALIDSMGGIPALGYRNTRLFDAASELRNVCDFDPYAIYAALKPLSSLSDGELLGVCQSACRYRFKPVISERMQAAIDLCGMEEGAQTETATASSVEFLLPSVMREYYSIAPESFKVPVLMALLPVLSVLCSRLRSPFNDRMEHLSFQEVVCAEPGSGKSFLTDVWRRCLRLVISSDEEARKKKETWEQLIRSFKLQQGRSKSERDELRELIQSEPHDPIRIVPENISMTALLEQLHDSQGLHVFQPLDEITIATAAEKRGWSCISNLLKVGFSGDKYAQNYKSENSFRGETRVLYNTLWAAQPATFNKFFTPEKWEDGTASRVLMIDLPDQRYKPFPRWKKPTPTQEAEMDATLARLNAISLDSEGRVQPEMVVEMPWLEETMNDWGERMRLQAQQEQNAMKDILRRRAAVYGFRAGMLCFALWDFEDGRTVRKSVKNFATFVADEALAGQLRHARTYQPTMPQPKIGIAATAYEALPDTFTKQELEQALAKYHFASPCHRIINQWVKNGVVERDKSYQAENFRKIHTAG